MIYFGTIAYVEMKFMGDILSKQIRFADIMGKWLVMGANLISTSPRSKQKEKQLLGFIEIQAYYS